MPTADELLRQIQAQKQNETPEDIRKKQESNQVMSIFLLMNQ